MQRHSITRSLNLPEYKIEKILSQDSEEIHIEVRPYKRKKFVCSGCGEEHKELIHGFTKVIVEDRPLIQQRVYLHVIKRRQRCLNDGRIHVEKIEWLKIRSRITRRYSKEIYRLTSISTNQEVGWYLGMDDEKIYRADKDMLKELFGERLSSTPTSKNISVDEVAWKKHHRYLTNVIDADEKVVTWNEKGRKAEVLDKYYDSIGKDNSKKIQSAAMDGARTYISSTKKYATNALIVLDRFHAVQKVNKSVDQVRRDELNKARKTKDEELVTLTNCKQRFVLFKKRRNLTERQTVVLKKLFEINQPIYKAMLLKEAFLQTYECRNIKEAREHLYQWIDQALFSGLLSLFELACSVLDKIEYILNWFKKRISSAISEGFNNKIKRLKRMAYGFKDIEYFKLKIHQHCGYLNPRRFSH